LLPFTVALGGPTPVTVEGTIDRQAYALAAKGDGSVRRLLGVATALGLRPPQLNAEGAAHLQLGISGAWQGFPAPTLTGNAQLRNVTADVKGVNAPLVITSSLLAFSGDRIDALSTTATFSGSRVTLQGDVHLPAGCSTLLDCPVRFELTSPGLNLDDLNRLFNPRFAAQPWYHFIVGSTPTTGLRRLRAEGTLSTPRLVVKSVGVSRVSATLRFANGRLLLQDQTGELFGGSEKGDWSADFSGATPVYTGTGSIEKADLAQLTTLMHDNWGAGAVSGVYKFSASGDTASDLVASATATLDFDWKNGLLRHVALRGAPLRIQRFRGAVALRDARLTFDPGRMETPDGIYTVSGTSTFARVIDFKLAGPTRSYSVTGTVERPRVIAPPASEAILKQ
jgi:AsmA-like protein